MSEAQPSIPPSVSDLPSEGDSPSRDGRPRPRRTEAPTAYAAGFWRRFGGGLIDLVVILPVSLVMIWLVGAVSNLSLPATRYRGIDFWLDLLLTNDPAMLTFIGVLVAVALVYLLVFQLTLGQTLGMRVTKTRIIDLYGDPPGPSIGAIRTAGYLVCLATLGLGFIWVAFDAEKRGLHDWLSRTYVVKV